MARARGDLRGMITEHLICEGEQCGYAGIGQRVLRVSTTFLPPHKAAVKQAGETVRGVGLTETRHARQLAYGSG